MPCSSAGRRASHEQRRASKVKVGGAARRLGSAGGAVRGNVVDKPMQASGDADVLVLRSHRWGPIHRLAVGSTTAGVPRKAHCPILVPPRTSAVPALEAIAESETEGREERARSSRFVQPTGP